MGESERVRAAIDDIRKLKQGGVITAEQAATMVRHVRTAPGKYNILFARNPAALQPLVIDAINSGYTPLGGMVFHPDGNRCFQTMLKDGG